MKNYRYLLLLPIITFVISLTFVNHNALALSCVQSTLQQHIDNASVIFAGKVISVQGATNEKSANATFEVSEYWKGEVGKNITVGGIYAWTGTPNPPPYFVVGNTYLVFAKNVPNSEMAKNISNNLIASISCGRTKPLESASEEKVTLGKGKVFTEESTYNFTRNLTINSVGDDVIALQAFLEQKGFLIMPPGVAKGFFGQRTLNAVAAYQRSISLPSFGFFGPLTREYLNRGNNKISPEFFQKKAEPPIEDKIITVVTPNGGEKLEMKSAYQISWKYLNATSDSKVDLYLSSGLGCLPGPNVGCTAYPLRQDITLDKNIPTNMIYNWIVGTDVGDNPIQAGNYYLKICVAGTSNCDISNQTFLILINSTLLKVCPNTKVMNKMPINLPDYNPIPPTYYILNGQRKELNEFDSTWVAGNCNVKEETVY